MKHSWEGYTGASRFVSSWGERLRDLDGACMFGKEDVFCFTCDVLCTNNKCVFGANLGKCEQTVQFGLWVHRCLVLFFYIYTVCLKLYTSKSLKIKMNTIKIPSERGLSHTSSQTTGLAEWLVWLFGKRLVLAFGLGAGRQSVNLYHILRRNQ